ncbi:SRPBCC family protein [Actinokineospora diospyrosa]|uniref:Activator of Hsp90 ATPase homolog 1-like protein n=1 Tax=Actinokineospora diospyrosa TaxID=103728 RepID=A0ABT1IBC4_9PSEU|nr:SRPBCC family protein [Actinokineospora diospyrosa]MCP2269924.1 Activator of Hsp90 ATPase homolog 1-like protein [Actinokineospora diospyrosa]
MSGELFRTATGGDLVLGRTFRGTPEDVWASVTEPERTARWFGRWEGTGAPGSTIRVQMAFEEGEPWFDARIEVCEPHRRLGLSTSDEAGNWHLELLLSEVADGTLLRLVHHLTTLNTLGEVGPGWDYYLDLLVAARTNNPPVNWDDYYPRLKPYYDGLTPID